MTVTRPQAICPDGSIFVVYFTFQLAGNYPSNTNTITKIIFGPGTKLSDFDVSKSNHFFNRIHNLTGYVSVLSIIQVNLNE
jgi:hypothetical protein